MDPLRMTTRCGAHEAEVHETDVELRARAARRFLVRSLAWERRLTTLRAAADGQPLAESDAGPTRVFEAA